jgi:hypothetical protein
MKSWNVNDLELKAHAPQILSSTKDARAIALAIAAGESLQDHQVHEERGSRSSAARPRSRPRRANEPRVRQDCWWSLIPASATPCVPFQTPACCCS